MSNTEVMPTLPASTCINGIIKINLLDFIYEVSTWCTFKACEFQIEIQYYHQLDCEWRTTTLNNSLLLIPHFCVYLKVAVEARMKINENDWSKWCDDININITSSLMDHSFAIHDVVAFAQENEFFVQKGMIINLLPDRYLLIKKAKTDEINSGTDLMKIHARKVMHDEVIYLDNLLDITNRQMDIDKTILLRTNDENIISIYQTLFEVYHLFSINNVDCCVWEFDLEYISMEATYISRIISVGICEYLLPIDRDYKLRICCLKESNDGTMKLISVWHDLLLAYMKGHESDIVDMDYLDDIEEGCYSCEICQVQLHEYDWKYICNESITDQHHICITCIYNIIKQYKQLNKLLKNILMVVMNDDCITEIVSFLIGIVHID
eukprot:321056_1